MYFNFYYKFLCLHYERGSKTFRPFKLFTLFLILAVTAAKANIYRILAPPQVVTGVFVDEKGEPLIGVERPRKLMDELIRWEDLSRTETFIKRANFLIQRRHHSINITCVLYYDHFWI